MASRQGGSNYPSASLYVGNLTPDVTEATLFEKFSQVGPVLSVRVCRDMVTKRSLAYAYVNFKQPEDAERALDTMNHDLVKGRPCRIMWSQRDPSLRRSAVGNIIIKNLERSINSEELHDTFSVFGNILSCKVETNDDNSSKGFGFIQFDSQESADLAIKKVNGMLINNQKVYVGKFNARIERFKGQGPNCYTNVYIKNFGEDYDYDTLVTTFEKFGTIVNAVIMKDDTGKSLGFGFVNFETHDAAAKAVEALNGKVVNGRPIYCGPAQNKKERQSCYHGVNLYIKYLHDKVDDERLKKEFEKCGTITSAKVMRHENGRSKGFGFVCFSSPKEAAQAITEMNGRIILSKPLFVGLAQSKEVRVSQLAALNMQPTAHGMQQSQRMQPTAHGMPQSQHMQLMAQGMPQSQHMQPTAQGMTQSQDMQPMAQGMPMAHAMPQSQHTQPMAHAMPQNQHMQPMAYAMPQNEMQMHSSHINPGVQGQCASFPTATTGMRHGHGGPIHPLPRDAAVAAAAVD